VLIFLLLGSALNGFNIFAKSGNQFFFALAGSVRFFKIGLNESNNNLKQQTVVVMSQEILIEYLPVLIFIGLASGMAFIAIAASYIVGKQNPDPEKNSSFECGFEPFEDARGRFDVRFYLVSILFIIFDLEIAFLFPWAVSLGKIGLFGFWSMVVFLGVLTIGFIYEWKKGALEWE